MHTKNVVIFGGGTISHVRSHLALCAPAYGSTARRIAELCQEIIPEMGQKLILTRMADSNSIIETNEDVAKQVKITVRNLQNKIVFFSCAMCDFNGEIVGEPSGKYSKRLHSKKSDGKALYLHTADKVVNA